MVKALSLLHKFLRPQRTSVSEKLEPARDFNIENFEYTILLKRYMKEKKNEIKKKNAAIREHNYYNRKDRKKIIVAHENSIMNFAVRSVDAFILRLKRGSNDDRKEARLLELEREYVRKLEKIKLAESIKAFNGTDGVGGEYTLNEAGLVLGITRQRAEQIEKEARRKIKRPDVGRRLKKAIHA